MSEDKPKHKPRRGRPPKSALEKARKGTRGKVGRPKGDTGILADYRARMIASPKSEKVLHKILDVALEDGHPHQAACMKLVAERMLHHSHFEKDKMSGSGKDITINLNFDQPGSGKVQEEAVDVEFSTVERGEDDAN